MVKSKVYNVLKYILSLAGAGILLYFSFRGVKWSDFLDGLKYCHWGFIIIAMAAGLAASYIRGLRWRLLLKPIDPETGRISSFNAVNIGYVANMVLPRVGEFVRCGYAAANSSEDQTGKKLATYDKVLGTVVLERIWDIISLVAVLAVFLLLGWAKYGDFFSEKIIAPASEKLNFSLWWIVLGLLVILSAIFRAIYVFRDRSRLCGKIHKFFQGILQGVGSCLKMEDKWMFIFQTILIFALYWLMSMSILWAVQFMDVSGLSPEMAAGVARLEGLGPVDAFFLMLVGSMSSIVPVPGGFGAFHYLVALAASTIYGLPFSLGIIFATLSHESQTVMMILAGAASYIYETLRKRKAE